jgi:hypothetical protein
MVKECGSATEKWAKQEEKKVRKKVDKVQNCWYLVEVIVWSRSISTIQDRDAIE